jgi:methionine aminopeptidase
MNVDQAEIEKMNKEAIQVMITTARNKTWKAIEDIKNLIKPGMSELEAIKLANKYFMGQGVRKFWHKTHIRFGASTILSFNDTYRENVILKENDIFYIDIGPVWDGVEGDCGNTFVIGSNPKYEKITKDIKVLFDDIFHYWKTTESTGKQLFDYSKTQVEKMNYLLEPSYVKGHRLSEFSHLKYTSMSLFDLDFIPSSERWILELQICDPSLKFGAFYEDLLF